MVDSWTRGTGDRIDGTGTNLQYAVYVMDNGDKILLEWKGLR